MPALWCRQSSCIKSSLIHYLFQRLRASKVVGVKVKRYLGLCALHSAKSGTESRPSIYHHMASAGCQRCSSRCAGSSETQLKRAGKSLNGGDYSTADPHILRNTAPQLQTVPKNDWARISSSMLNARCHSPAAHRLGIKVCEHGHLADEATVMDWWTKGRVAEITQLPRPKRLLKPAVGRKESRSRCGNVSSLGQTITTPSRLSPTPRLTPARCPQARTSCDGWRRFTATSGLIEDRNFEETATLCHGQGRATRIKKAKAGCASEGRTWWIYGLINGNHYRTSGLLKDYEHNFVVIIKDGKSL